MTDFDVQGMWLTRHVDRYFVALDETRAHLERLGVPPAAITVSGIPIDPCSPSRRTRAPCGEKHGLAPDRTTILMSAGGFGVGPVEALVHMLLELQHPAQLVVICGRSEELKRGSTSWPPPARRTDAPRSTWWATRPRWTSYMAAADLLVGKPGGLTSSEALARGLALVIVQSDPRPGGAERRSSPRGGRGDPLQQPAGARLEDRPAAGAIRRG